MANYVVGDVQGCFDEFSVLLAKIRFNPAVDKLFLLGDLVNRGPGSLQILRWAFQHRSVCNIVLGNHDLHMLAVYFGVRSPQSGDTFSDVLSAPDGALLLNWLRSQPLALFLDWGVLVHAGWWPGWTLTDLKIRAEYCQSVLAGDDINTTFNSLYGRKPVCEADCESDSDRLRFYVNTMTRMRFVDASTHLDLAYKGEIDSAPKGLKPWFDVPNSRDSCRVFFGHWSALGLVVSRTIVALDTGCIWGGELTAFCVESGQVFSVNSKSDKPCYGD